MSTPSVCKNCIYLYQAECNHSHGPLVPNEVSCGGKVAGGTGRKGTEMKSLYGVTGNVCDINTMLINKVELDGKLKQCRDAALDEAADHCDKLQAYPATEPRHCAEDIRILKCEHS